MTGQKELRLREILLEMAANPSPTGLDDFLPDLIETRLNLDDFTIREETIESHLDAIRRHADARTGLRPEPVWRSWLRTPTLAWAAAAAVILALLWLGWSSFNRAPVAKSNPAPRRQLAPSPQPERGPVVKQGPKKKPLPLEQDRGRVVEQEPRSPSLRPDRDRGRVAEQLAPKPRRSPRPHEHGLLAARVPLGAFESVMGEPTVSRIGGAAAPSAKGSAKALPKTTVYAGTRIETGDADRCTVRFNDGTTLTLDFNTVLEIPAPPNSKLQAPISKLPLQSSIVNRQSSIPRPAQVDLKSGHVWAKVVHSPDQSFAVATSVATATDLGTEFGLELRHEKNRKSAVLQVRKGSVRFENGLGSVVAAGGTESTATDRSKPTEPRRLTLLRMRDLPRARLLFEAHKQTWIWNEQERFAWRAGKAEFRVQTTEEGVNVRFVEPHSAAEKAGLMPGDIFDSVEGERVRNGGQVLRAFLARPSAWIHVAVRRVGSMTNLTIWSGRLTEGQSTLSPNDLDDISAATRPALAGTPESLKEAMSRLRKIIGNRAVAAAYNNLGVLEELSGQLTEAVGHYRQAAKVQPKCALFHFNLGLILGEIGNSARGIEELELSTRLDPSWYLPHSELADAYDATGRFEDAVAVTSGFRQRFPNDARGWGAEAVALRNAGRPNDALMAVHMALTLNPKDGQRWLDEATILYSLNQIRPALDAVRHSIEIDPLSGYSFYVLMGLTMQVDPSGADRPSHLKEAKWAIRRAAKLSDDVLIHNAFAQFLEADGDLDGAEREYRRNYEREPWNAQLSINNLAMFLAAHGRHVEEAARLANRAVALVPADGTVRDTLAFVLMRQGKVDDAIRNYRYASTLYGPEEGSEHADTLASLGAAYESKGDKLSALASYRDALKLNPDQQQAKSGVKRLGG